MTLLLIVELLHVRPELIAGLRVEPERRLVEENDFRRMQQAARDFEPPLHAARELLHRIVAPLPKLEQFQQLLRAFAREFCEARRRARHAGPCFPRP